MLRLLSLATLAAGALLAAGAAEARYTVQYEVTITNITKGQTFTPQLVVTHSRNVSLFQLGRPASLPLEILAEAGDTAPQTDALLAEPHQIADVRTIPGLLGPGESVSVVVEADRFHPYLSMAAMLIPTNDNFVAVNAMRLPFRGQRSKMLLAYDAGTERNDQNCLNIPGPRCGGAGHSPGPNDGDEGFVYVGNGFHELADAAAGEVLSPLEYDWRNPVAEIVVRATR